MGIFALAHKYRLAEDFYATIGIKPAKDIVTSHIVLRSNGRLQIKRGYFWGGLRCPLLRLSSVKRAALIHDALYELMRDDLLPKCCKPVADRSLALLAIDDGTPVIVAKALRLLAKFAYSVNSSPRPQVHSGHLVHSNAVKSQNLRNIRFQ